MAIAMLLGVASKPSVVVLPVLLLLLDFWPLRRFEDTDLRGQLHQLRSLVVGKAPSLRHCVDGRRPNHSRPEGRWGRRLPGSPSAGLPSHRRRHLAARLSWQLLARDLPLLLQLSPLYLAEHAQCDDARAGALVGLAPSREILATSGGRLVVVPRSNPADDRPDPGREPSARQSLYTYLPSIGIAIAV